MEIQNGSKRRANSRRKNEKEIHHKMDGRLEQKEEGRK
jgi:hypothetical protein